MEQETKTKNTVCRNLRIERSEICFFKYLFEAYEGIAVLETIDAKAGHIALHTAPGCEFVVEDIISDLSSQYRIEEI
ncbi:MAG: DUF4911 domain-containing protein [Desulfobacteraceae bacterium]|nr:DUF4911 domain-containing protein [Desulfobacteraceae bacterium]MCF8094747.1 DUF4911 domain-containing protein [Desulfobacteraceae bacterium]